MTRPKLLVLIIALALLGIVFLYFTSSRHLTSEEAEVSLAVETVSAQVTGYVIEVNAQNGETVAVGDVLVRLDPTDYEVALRDAKAVLDAMEKGTPQAVAQSLYASRQGQPDPAELEARLADARQALKFGNHVARNIIAKRNRIHRRVIRREHGKQQEESPRRGRRELTPSAGPISRATSPIGG